MQATIYIKNEEIWKNSKEIAKQCGMSHSEYIEIALLRMTKYTIEKEVTIKLKHIDWR